MVLMNLIWMEAIEYFSSTKEGEKKASLVSVLSCLQIFVYMYGDLVPNKYRKWCLWFKYSFALSNSYQLAVD